MRKASAPVEELEGNRDSLASNSTNNRVSSKDRVAHDWYRFVLSYPPHLVREYLKKFGVDSNQRVLDPFCGTGTTIVECKIQGIPSVGVEAHPMSYFASKVKTDWSPEPNGLIEHANAVAQATLSELSTHGIDDYMLLRQPLTQIELDGLRNCRRMPITCY